MESIAQKERSFFQWEIKINAGYNIGGTSPLPLPVEIRKIEKFSPPILAPHVALEGNRWFNEKWGLSAQLAMDYKGFTVHDQVKNLHTEIEMGDDNYTGNFTGKNTTEIRNTYITLPVMATYRISNKWTTQFGPYIAYLYHPDFKGTASDGYIRQGSPIGEKIDVPEASFDFSREQSRVDYGLLLAGEWKFSTDFALRGQVSWGLKSVFPSNFTGMSFAMYNLYGMIGVSYRIKYF
jgi:hypothetical protein